jgi:hypothetical protein
MSNKMLDYLGDLLYIDDCEETDLQWTRCARCGGDLPTINGDNGHHDLPELETEGECPGSITEDGLCGAYRGWTQEEITQYIKDLGYTV